MSKCIDKDVLLEKMQEKYYDLMRNYGDFGNYVTGFGDAIVLLRDMSASDMQKVKHAKWVHYGEYCQCSNCEFITDDIYFEGDVESGHYTLPHYCSNCGCKMDLEDNDV